MMTSVFTFLETRLMPPLNKLANLRFIRAIMQAGIITVPFTIVGSIFLSLIIYHKSFHHWLAFSNKRFYDFHRFIVS